MVMTFRIGDSVRVKEGIMCPDDDSVCMGGWQGRIFEIEACDDIVGIRWDSITLKQLPREYIKQSEEEGMGWTEMYLSVDEVDPASPRDSQTQADTLRQKMEGELVWLGEGKEGERILKVIANSDDKVQAWNSHLSQVLSFPFEAEVSEPQGRGSLDQRDKVKVHGIVEADDHYGVLVDIVCEQHRCFFPLCDLTVLDKKSLSYTPVRDYCVWFANR